MSAVKSWASRDWKKKSCDPPKKKVATNQKEKLQPKKPRGAPKGNENAVGNKGGAPIGSANALKHGGYSHRTSTSYWDFLDDDEECIVNDIPEDTEQMLIEQIKLYHVRERWLMRIIREEKARKGGLAISSVVRAESRKEFKDEAEQQQYNDIVAQKQSEEKISYFGHEYSTQTATENVLKIVQGLESELTRVQRAKTQAISELQRLRENKKLKRIQINLRLLTIGCRLLLGR